MKKVTVHVAKTNLSRLLRQVEAGEEIIICRGNQEVAKLIATNPAAKKPRIPGLLKGQIHLAESFFDPLPPGYDGLPEGE